MICEVKCGCSQQRRVNKLHVALEQERQAVSSKYGSQCSCFIPLTVLETQTLPVMTGLESEAVSLGEPLLRHFVLLHRATFRRDLRSF